MAFHSVFFARAWKSASSCPEYCIRSIEEASPSTPLYSRKHAPLGCILLRYSCVNQPVQCCTWGAQLQPDVSFSPAANLFNRRPIPTPCTLVVQPVRAQRIPSPLTIVTSTLVQLTSQAVQKYAVVQTMWITSMACPQSYKTQKHQQSNVLRRVLNLKPPTVFRSAAQLCCVDRHTTLGHSRCSGESICSLDEF